MLKKILRKLHIIHNIYIKHKFFIKKKSYAMDNEDIAVLNYFKDKKNGEYKIISFYAKKARGLMSAYAIKNGILEATKLKKFDAAGYAYNNALSQGNNWVFTREEQH